MHNHSIEAFQHDHFFLGEHHARNERMTWIVIALCGAMMIAEIVGGLWFGSMALIADGLHMSTHAGALLIAALAYTYARVHARDERFSFGTGKLGDLAAFSSALILAMISLLIGWQSVVRLWHPVPIAFTEAIPIAAGGLVVNLISAWLLRDQHHGHHAHHDDVHTHDHHHGHHHHDLNIRAAYIHVLADAAVSVVAVVGLITARQLGWLWIDPILGIVGACVIMNWSWGLVRAAGSTLLDMSPDATLGAKIRKRLENDGDQIADLHIWRVGPGHVAAAISLVSDQPEPPAAYKYKLSDLDELSHLTIEVQRCHVCG